MHDFSDIKISRRDFPITGATSVAAVTLPPAVAAQPAGATVSACSRVSLRLLAGARTAHDNAFKVCLVERTLASVLPEAKAQA